ncbi:MAG: hypothetical protein C0609_02615 [Deltaproteobacteria bacterium]|nr:MAG: hypothetical protein C0609_02615 [Deltaproteobacteria bacterium]
MLSLVQPSGAAVVAVKRPFGLQGNATVNKPGDTLLLKNVIERDDVGELQKLLNSNAYTFESTVKIGFESRVGVDRQEELSLLKYALLVNSTKISDWLLTRKLPFSPNRDEILFAARGLSYEVIPRLVDEGGDIDIVGQNGMTPLLIAVEHCTKSEGFLSAGSQAEEEEEEACVFTMRMLIGLEADPDAKSDSGKTPLTMAVRANAPTPVRLLLDAGADVNLQGVDEMKPYDLARFYNLDKMTSILLASDPSLESLLADEPARGEIPMPDIYGFDLDSATGAPITRRLLGDINIVAIIDLRYSANGSSLLSPLMRLKSNYPSLSLTIAYLSDREKEADYQQNSGGNPLTLEEFLNDSRHKLTGVGRLVFFPDDEAALEEKIGLGKRVTVLLADKDLMMTGIFRGDDYSYEEFVRNKFKRINPERESSLELAGEMIALCSKGDSDGAMERLESGAAVDALLNSLEETEIGPRMVNVTPMVVAAEHGDVKLLKALIDRKANPGFPTYFNQAQRALERALEFRKTDTARMLLDYAEGYDLESALRLAVTYTPRDSVVDKLLQLGADIDRSRVLGTAVFNAEE